MDNQHQRRGGYVTLLRFIECVMSVVCIACVPGSCPAQTATNVASPALERTTYILGPGDEVLIHVLDCDEVGDKPFGIDMSGDVNVPLAGRLHAAGLTVGQLEAAFTTRFREYLQKPVVVVSVSGFASHSVSILGAVGKPSIIQLRGQKTLFEVISEAGGLKNEAGNSIKLTRRKDVGRIPLRNAALDPSGEFWVADVSVKAVMEARNPQENVEILPDDVISVPRADLVYVIGAVKRAGGFVLTEREHISVLQALSMAEGLDRLASPSKARILRNAEVGSRREIPIEVRNILAGKAADVPMQANDILFIRTSATKNAALRGVEAAIALGTGVAIYRR